MAIQYLTTPQQQTAKIQTDFIAGVVEVVKQLEMEVITVIAEMKASTIAVNRASIQEL